MPGLRFTWYDNDTLEIIFDDDTLGYVRKIAPGSWRMIYPDDDDTYATPQDAARVLMIQYGYD
jgi:hypothetical protein